MSKSCITWSLAIAYASAAIYSMAIGQIPTRSQNEQVGEDAKANTSTEATLEHDQLVSDLQSGIEERKREAIDKIYANAVKRGLTRVKQLQPLIDAEMYVEAEEIAVRLIANIPSSYNIGNVQKFRTQIRIRQKQWDEALPHAKAYYLCATLKQTDDAVDLICLCLINGGTNGTELAKRFKQQQTEWAKKTPSTVPSDQQSTASHPNALTSTTEPGDEPSILQELPSIDAKAFIDAAEQLPANEYMNFQFRGNLLLIAGRAAEAKKVFQQGAILAKKKDFPQAVEDIARAIRTENSAIAPANDYIFRVRETGQP